MKQFSVGTWHINDPTLAFGRAYPFGAPKRLEFQLPSAWSNSMGAVHLLSGTTFSNV